MKDRAAAKRFRAGYNVQTAADGHEAETMAQAAAFDLVLCDWKMPVAGGGFLLRQRKQEADGDGLPIIMTAHGTGPNAMKAMELGAYDFVTKPLDADEVLASIERVIRHADLQWEVEELRRQRFRSGATAEEVDDARARLVGGSPAWLAVFKAIGKVARTDVSVLLEGESGSGKEVVAHTIHENSPRSRKPFTVINCAALPPELMESELFGHERGSFTGALAQKLGKFEAATGGTVFLNEIGELPSRFNPNFFVCCRSAPSSASAEPDRSKPTSG